MKAQDRAAISRIDTSVRLRELLLEGFTTFSSYSIQTVLLGEQKQFFAASAYFVCSPVIGVVAAWLGASAARLASH